MRDLGYVAMGALVEVPTLLVMLVGMVLAVTGRWRLPRRPRLLMLSGLAVLLIVMLLSIAWAVLLPRMFGYAWGRSHFELFTLVNVALHALTYPLGLGLMIAAAFAGRRATGTGQAWDGWTPPSSGEPAPAAADAPPAPGAPAADGYGWETGGASPDAPQWGGRSRPDAPVVTPSGADAPDRT